MQLYKKRDFSSFFSDTFEFIKLNGAHFFKQFITINGFLILILAAISYVFTTFFFQDLVGSITTGDTGSKLDTIMNENFGLFIGLLISLITVSIFFGVISYAFTPIYFNLYENHGNNNFTTKDIVDSYKKNAGKIILFVLLGILISIPILIAVGIVAFILTITIVGMLLLPLLIGFYAGIYNMTFIEYLGDKRDFFDSFGYSWKLITSKFWPAVGCMGIFYFISFVAQMSFSIIQSIFSKSMQLTDTVQEETSMILIIITLVLFVITFFASILLNAILQINQSVVYYGLKEQKENKNTKSVIDLIGTDEA